MTRRFYDNTMISDYRECPRYYYLRHIRGWRGEGISAPLAFGLSWHDAMDVVWDLACTLGPAATEHTRAIVAEAGVAFDKRWTEEGLPSDAGRVPYENEWGKEIYDKRNPMVAREMLSNYIPSRRHIFEQATLIAVEQPFAVPLEEDGQTWYIGRLDKVIQMPGQGVIIEHKSTSEYQKDGGFKKTWEMEHTVSTQGTGYLFGAAATFPGVDQVWIDGALVHKTVHDAFKFLPSIASMEGLDQWLYETKRWIGRIEEETAFIEHELTRQDLMPAFAKNTKQCIGKYGVCSYYNACHMSSGQPNQWDKPPVGYVEERWEPFKILNIEKLGLEDKE